MLTNDRTQFLASIQRFKPENQVSALSAVVLMLGGSAFENPPTDAYLNLVEQHALEHAASKAACAA
tara:strand:- start:104 stop:301 length:198 start_codon:yes stop_codon:yes gene_type:complete